MSTYYLSEAERALILRKLFKQHFTINPNSTELINSKPDGTWLPNAKGDVVLNAQMKKELGAGGDLRIQNVAYNKQYLCQNDKQSFT